jgi:Na+-driven multidrug efflux pump
MQKDIRKQVFSLALPVVLSSLLQRSVGIVDIFLVGGLGAASIAAVGIAQAMVFLVMSLSWGINVGVTVQVAQLWGAGRKGDAAQAAYQAMLLAVGAAALISSAESRSPKNRPGTMSLLLRRYRKERWGMLEI